LTGCQSFNASYFQKLNEQVEVAYKAFWSTKCPAMIMEVGAKYNVGPGSFVKTKIDNSGRLGIAIANELRPGMQLTMGALLDTNKLSENAHKFGLELNYAA
jgi:voltage-dependent anion channel protein 2